MTEVTVARGGIRRCNNWGRRTALVTMVERLVLAGSSRYPPQPKAAARISGGAAAVSFAGTWETGAPGHKLSLAIPPDS